MATNKSSSRRPRATLHAPWRIEYIRSLKDAGCFLCEAAKIPEGDEQAWRRGLLLYRDAQVLVVMNRYPYTGGHLLIAPLRHTSDLAGLPEEESAALWNLSRRCIKVLAEALQPHGFNVGLNLGRAGGAGLEEHLHLHALPRWVGDTNFLPILSGTHSIPIALAELWDQLRPAFRSQEAKTG